MDVTVVDSGGTSPITSSDKLTYAPAAVPLVSAISPMQGLSGDDTPVTITGAGFTGATSVKFGNLAATSFAVVLDTQILATSPVGSAGTVDVSVVTPGGISASDKFTYMAVTEKPPTLFSFDSVVPDQSTGAASDAERIHFVWRHSGRRGRRRRLPFSACPSAAGRLRSSTRFDGGDDGNEPTGGLALIGQLLYGTTRKGGVNGYGTIFTIPLGGGTLTTLYSFADDAYGGRPDGGLTLDASGTTLYGTTESGGANNCGVIFSIPAAGGTPTVLYSFTDPRTETPSGGLTIAGSTLFWATEYGGAGGTGAVWKMPVAGGAPAILCEFGDTDGALPLGGLVLAGSVLYGTTMAGGATGAGTVFSVPTGGGNPTTLFSFRQCPRRGALRRLSACRLDPLRDDRRRRRQRRWDGLQSSPRRRHAHSLVFFRFQPRRLSLRRPDARRVNPVWDDGLRRGERRRHDLRGHWGSRHDSTRQPDRR